MKHHGSLLLFIFALFQSAEVRAYVPPSEFIVKTMASKKSGIKALRLKNTFTAMEGDRAVGPLFKETVWVDYGTRALRSRVTDETGREFYALERKLDFNAPPGDLLIFENQGESLARGLKACGIPIRTGAELGAMRSETERRISEMTSLGRTDSVPVWIIGNLSAAGGASNPQLWIEKDAFVPSRLILRRDDRPLQMRFEGFHFIKEIPFPKTVWISPVGSESAIRLESVEVLVNPEMSEFKNPLRPGFTDAAASADSSVQNLIRSFYQTVR